MSTPDAMSALTLSAMTSQVCARLVNDGVQAGLFKHQKCLSKANQVAAFKSSQSNEVW